MALLITSWKAKMRNGTLQPGDFHVHVQLCTTGPQVAHLGLGFSVPMEDGGEMSEIILHFLF